MVVEILADPCHWGIAWNGLKNMDAAYSIIDELPVLDFYFLSEYLQAEKENVPHLYYLDQKSVTLLQSGGTPTILAQAIATTPPLVFLLVKRCRNFEHPFFMLLNLQTHEALLISVRVNQEQNIAEENWFQEIWRGVTSLFGGPNQYTRPPTILYGNWITVRLYFVN